MIKQSGTLLVILWTIFFAAPPIWIPEGLAEELSNELAATENPRATVSPKKTATSPTGYAIQTGVFLIMENARQMMTNLRMKGYEPYIFQTVNDKKQKLYVVRIGDYRTLRQASSAADQFKNLEHLPAVITPINSTKAVDTPLYLTTASKNGVISTEELSEIDGGTGSLIDSEELATIDGQTGAILQTDELSQIAAQSGTVITTDEMAVVDGRTGTIIPADEMATVDGRTGTVVSPGELATVDGRTGTVVPSGELATVDGQTGQAIPKGDLSKIRAQSAGVSFSPADDAEPFVFSQKATKEDAPQEDDPFGISSEQEGGGQGIDNATARQLKDQIEALQEKVNELREEADVRKILEITEEEKQEEEEEILSATGRDYTMAKKGSIGFDYGLSYTYNSFDAIEDAANLTKIEHRAQHNVTNSLGLVYAVRDNVSFGANIPFVYSYDSMGTESPKKVTDIGDVSLSLQWQPLKAGGSLPPGILSFSFTMPSGRSPYEINPEEELSTGSGLKSLSAGLSLNHPMDPVVTYGGITYGYSLPLENLDSQRYGDILTEVHPGQSIGIRLGLGYALSYQLNMNLNLSYSYQFGAEYVYRYSGIQPSADSASANFSIGTGWRISPTRSLNISLSKGLSNDASDFSLGLSVPFNF
ncbi:MAG: SPOR domain-containing protein [Thermodesulfobacteriota bacterium]